MIGFDVAFSVVELPGTLAAAVPIVIAPEIPRAKTVLVLRMSIDNLRNVVSDATSHVALKFSICIFGLNPRRFPNDFLTVIVINVGFRAALTVALKSTSEPGEPAINHPQEYWPARTLDSPADCGSGFVFFKS